MLIVVTCFHRHPESGWLIQLTLRESRDLDADQLDMTLVDHDGALALPPGGAELQLAFGWVEDGFVDKGRYTVDEITHSGTPDQPSLRARSADMRHTLPGKRSQSWHDTTAGEIVTTITERHDLPSPCAGPAQGRDTHKPPGPDRGKRPQLPHPAGQTL